MQEGKSHFLALRQGAYSFILRTNAKKRSRKKFFPSALSCSNMRFIFFLIAWSKSFCHKWLLGIDNGSGINCTLKLQKDSRNQTKNRVAQTLWCRQLMWMERQTEELPRRYRKVRGEYFYSCKDMPQRQGTIVPGQFRLDAIRHLKNKGCNRISWVQKTS